MKFAAIIALASMAFLPAIALAEGPRDGRGAQVQRGAGEHGPKKHNRKHHHKKHKKHQKHDQKHGQKHGQKHDAKGAKGAKGGGGARGGKF